MSSHIHKLIEKRRLHKKIRDNVLLAVNACYGTDDRHELIATAVADAVVDDKPQPWGLGTHFGRAS